MLNGRGRGDQFVTIRVEVPRKLTPEQREALEKFGQAMGEGQEKSAPDLDESKGEENAHGKGESFFSRRKKK